MTFGFSGWAMIALASLSLCIGVFGPYIYSRMQSGSFIHRMSESTYAPVVRDIALFVFMVGIPFVALLTGIARVDLMALGVDLANPDQVAGFTFVNWMRAFGIGAFVAACALFVLWLGARSAPAVFAPASVLIEIRDAIYDEVHWTFYRVAPALLLNDVYAGVIIGAVLILVEWLARPGKHFADSFTGNRQALVLRLACLLASAFLYLATQNLYVMIVVHCVVMLVGSQNLLRKSPC